MFFEGSLQEGIAASIQQGKSVVCFVTDDGEESQTWESEYLTESTVSAALENEGVTLRLKAGSEEAGFLAAIFPLPKTPTLVIIKNGNLKGYIAAGVSKEDFVSRTLVSLTPTPAVQPGTSTTASVVATEAQPSNSSSSSAGPPTPTQAEEDAANVRNLLADRRVRLEAQRKAADRKAKEARAARAAAQASDMSPEAVEHRKHAERIKKQRQEAAEERNRVLKRIQDDKAERQARSAGAREPKIGDVAASLATVESSSMRPSNGQAALQVRLFDGSSIRTRFDGKKATLKNEVRAWIDEKRTDGDEPYVFKLLLPPPEASKKIDETEEGKTLGELNLAPSATLLLSPVKKYVEAYGWSRGGVLGLPLVAFGFIAGFFAWLWGLIMGVFSGIGGREDRAHAREESERQANEDQAARVREQRGARFAQFDNPNDRRGDQQLYNGNSLNFEPNPDEADKTE
ncbi:hypothetical protein F5X68DRAFT_55248 [Plectosphaerella plurivora]|uniref:UBX domain-containing protein 2 n=1 Tax=Plectosphaerella plurivora TaxID=936078 RepID=A0A9P8V1R3_9PEZI|nr:hypothetical protein F5X68DRAFT_55248 [Plectosphaerella plurivora]